MTIHGLNLVFLLIPFMFFYLAYKMPKGRKVFIGLGLLALIAMPIKLVVDSGKERADSVLLGAVGKRLTYQISNEE